MLFKVNTGIKNVEWQVLTNKKVIKTLIIRKKVENLHELITDLITDELIDNNQIEILFKYCNVIMDIKLTDEINKFNCSAWNDKWDLLVDDVYLVTPKNIQDVIKTYGGY